MAWWEDASKTGRRWIFKNLSGETIPGFACIGLDPYQAADLHSTASIALWQKDARCLQARQPNAVHEDLQNPRLIAFNLQDPVIKDSWGFCTFDKPAIALVDRNEGLYVGDPVGPRAGCWHLSEVGDAFVYLGSDPADPFDWKENVTIDSTSVSVHYGTGMVDIMPFWGRTVMTPSGGITARSGTTLNSAMCNAYRDRRGSAGTGTLEALLNAAGNPYQIRVFNTSNGAVGGSRYVTSSRMLSGMRYVVVESCAAEA